MVKGPLKQVQFRGVARGGAEGARAPPEFSRSVNPIQTRGGELCPSHYCQPPPGFKKLSTSLIYVFVCFKSPILKSN